MKNIIFLLFFVPLFSFGQEAYQWKNIEKITFYDFSARDPNCEISSVDQIPKDIRSVNCNIPTWTAVLSKLTTNENDLLSESCYLLVIKFKNGTRVPFQFFPRQKVIMDLRKDHWNSLSFKKEIHNKVDELFKECSDCLKDPKCSESK